jgi:hypothetical protein
VSWNDPEEEYFNSLRNEHIKNFNYKPQKMANYNSGYNRIQTDKFGNPVQLKTALQVVSKKGGEVLPIYKTWLEVGGKLIKVEISHRNKEHKSGREGMWVKFTAMSKRPQSRSSF